MTENDIRDKLFGTEERKPVSKDILPTTAELITMLQILFDNIDPFIKFPYASTTISGVNPDSTEWILKETIKRLKGE